MPGVLGAGMQTIVNIPNGIYIETPQGHLASVSKIWIPHVDDRNPYV